jgi:hypothetical protein
MLSMLAYGDPLCSNGYNVSTINEYLTSEACMFDDRVIPARRLRQGLLFAKRPWLETAHPKSRTDAASP